MTIQINGTGIITGLNDNTIADSVVSRTTPAQFDNDTSFATTEFVQRALGNVASITGFTTSTVLTGAIAGHWIFPSGAGITLTLPLLSSVPIGTTMNFSGNGSGCTIQRQGTDTLTIGGNVVSSYVMPVHETATFIKVTEASWYLLGGSGFNQYATDFGASLTTNGYQKLPSGLIIQWGSAAAPAAGSSSTITLPISFTTAFLSCSVVEGAAADSTNILSYGTRNHTVSNFVIANRVTSGGSIVRWIAIGY